MLPRVVHPGAWWLWALGLAAAASRTTNPLLLCLIIAVAGFVVVRRRTDAPWAVAFRLYLQLGLVIIALRIGFRIIFGGGQGEHVLFVLPQIPLPAWAAGIRLFGPVATEQLLGGAYDGLRLATMLVCIGAANALANPKRMLKAVPGALYEIGTAVTVALSVAPQLVDSVQRVRRARALRGGAGKGMRALRGIVIPVLTDALDRSIALAAAMDSRGYGRRAHVSAGTKRLTGFLIVAGLIGVCGGLYGLLDGGAAPYLGAPMLAAGVGVAVLGFVLGGRQVTRTVYRPDRWLPAEFLVAGSGIVAAAALQLTSSVDAANLYPSLNPLRWPEMSPMPALGILVAVLPAWLSPPPPLTAEAAA